MIQKLASFNNCAKVSINNQLREEGLSQVNELVIFFLKCYHTKQCSFSYIFLYTVLSHNSNHIESSIEWLVNAITCRRESNGKHFLTAADFEFLMKIASF